MAELRHARLEALRRHRHQLRHRDPADFGRFVSRIPAPLGIGKVMLADGEMVSGFLCEAYATDGAQEVTHLGGWRAYIAAVAKQ